MDLTPWNPWKEMDRVQAEARRLLGSVLEKLRQTVPGPPIAFLPPLDIVEAEDGIRLYVSLPGAVEEDLDLSIEGDTLILRGEVDPPYAEGTVRVHEQEWKYGYFERRVRLPRRVEPEEIRARYEGGVLRIDVPRAPAPAPEGTVPEAGRPQSETTAEGKGDPS